mgnify:CR=1 FL=1
MSQKKKIYRVAIVGGMDHPIPAIHGGAIQTLVTALLDKNEDQGFFKFDVYTCADKMLNSLHYKKTTIYQINHRKLFIQFWIGVYRLFRKLSGNILPYKNAFMLLVNLKLSRQKYDAIIYETSDNEYLQVKRHDRERILFHVHADYLKNDSYGIERIVNNCDKFVAVSDFIKSRLQNITEDADKIVVLRNAVDVEQFQKLSSAQFRKSIRGKYGIKDDDFLLLYCSRLSPEKGCLELLKAVESIPSCKLLIVGGENFDSNDITPYVQKLLKHAEKLQNRVIFTGYVAHEDVAKYMYAVDAAVVPSVCNEACSLTLLEFMACGLPTIASNTGGIPEFCNDSTTIKVTLEKNFEENLRKAIIKILDDVQLRTSMGSAARNLVERFDYMNYYSHFCEMIDTLCGGNEDGNQSKEQ